MPKSFLRAPPMLAPRAVAVNPMAEAATTAEAAAGRAKLWKARRRELATFKSWDPSTCSCRGSGQRIGHDSPTHPYAWGMVRAAAVAVAMPRGLGKVCASGLTRCHHARLIRNDGMALPACVTAPGVYPQRRKESGLYLAHHATTAGEATMVSSRALVMRPESRRGAPEAAASQREGAAPVAQRAVPRGLHSRPGAGAPPAPCRRALLALDGD